MSVTSDPFIEAVRTPGHDEWQQHQSHPLVDTMPPAVVQTARARRGWQYLSIVAALAAVVYAASRVLAVFAAPLTTVSAADAPAWMIELSATGDRPVTALIYGDEVGLQVVRVPAASEGKGAPRLIPARLAKGEIHIVALNLATLHAQASAPKGAPAMAWTATGPVITAFQKKDATGVRIGW
jgi:hypothetical protein